MKKIQQSIKKEQKENSIKNKELELKKGIQDYLKKF